METKKQFMKSVNNTITDEIAKYIFAERNIESLLTYLQENQSLLDLQNKPEYKEYYGVGKHFSHFDTIEHLLYYVIDNISVICDKINKLKSDEN